MPRCSVSRACTFWQAAVTARCTSAVTSDLLGRIYQHRTKVTRGFTSRYAVFRLVHYELADTMDAAIAREKQLKAWKRDWKIALIEDRNPTWDDLALSLGFEALAATR